MCQALVDKAILIKNFQLYECIPQNLTNLLLNKNKQQTTQTKKDITLLFAIRLSLELSYMHIKIQNIPLYRKILLSSEEISHMKDWAEKNKTWTVPSFQSTSTSLSYPFQWKPKTSENLEDVYLFIQNGEGYWLNNTVMFEVLSVSPTYKVISYFKRNGHHFFHLEQLIHELNHEDDNESISTFNRLSEDGSIEDMFSFVDQHPELKSYLNHSAGVSEGWSVREQTQRVLKIVDSHLPIPSSIRLSKGLFKRILLFHDIGKGVCQKRQHVQTIMILNEYGHLFFHEKELKVAILLISHDLLGRYIKNVKDPSILLQAVCLKEALGLYNLPFAPLIWTYYQADSGSYDPIFGGHLSLFLTDRKGFKKNSQNELILLGNLGQRKQHFFDYVQQEEGDNLQPLTKIKTSPINQPKDHKQTPPSSDSSQKDNLEEVKEEDKTYTFYVEEMDFDFDPKEDPNFIRMERPIKLDGITYIPIIFRLEKNSINNCFLLRSFLRKTKENRIQLTDFSPSTKKVSYKWNEGEILTRFCQKHNITFNVSIVDSVYSSQKKAKDITYEVIAENEPHISTRHIQVNITEALQDIVELGIISNTDYQDLIDFIILNELIQGVAIIEGGEKEPMMKEKLESGSLISALLTFSSFKDCKNPYDAIQSILISLRKVSQYGGNYAYQKKNPFNEKKEEKVSIQKQQGSLSVQKELLYIKRLETLLKYLQNNQVIEKKMNSSWKQLNEFIHHKERLNHQLTTLSKQGWSLLSSA